MGNDYKLYLAEKVLNENEIVRVRGKRVTSEG